MGFRTLLETEVLVRPGDNADENIVNLYGCFSRETTQAPSGTAICVYCQLDNSDTSDTHHIFQWDSLTGLRLDAHVMTSTSGLGDRLAQQRMQGFSNNQILVRESVYFVALTFDEINNTYEKVEEPGRFPILPPNNEIFWWEDKSGGQLANEDDTYWDPVKDIVAQRFSFVASTQRGEIRAYDRLTGLFNGVASHVASRISRVFDVGAPFCMATSHTDDDSGGHVITMFNVETGVVFWTTRTAAPPSGSSQRRLGWDRRNRRILIADLSPQDGLSGEETLRIRAYSPTPIAYTLIQPVTSREPRVNGTTKIWTRVIGDNGEGIAGCAVTFADEGVGDVAPVIVISDQYGYAEAIYDGLAVGGAETITVTCEIPDDAPVSPSSGFGAGVGTDQWVPELHLDFNGVAQGADVSAIIPEQFDWDDGTAFGTSGDTIVKRVNKTSSADLTIETGTAGTPTDATNGTWGGGLTPAASEQVAEGERVWVGAWVYFEAGFDYTTSGAGLLCLRIGNDATANYIEINLKHAATEMTGWVYENPDQTVTEANHDFTAQSSGQINDATWYWVQYSCLAHSDGAIAEQRIWLNNFLVWELVGTAGRNLITGSASLQDFTAAESIPTLSDPADVLDELIVFNNFEGNAPQTQTVQVGNVVWTKDPDDNLGVDIHGNKYISPTIASVL